MEELHHPVLLSEVLRVLQPKPGEAYLDLTAGYAGHAKKILDVTRNYKDAVLVDRDEFAVSYLHETMADKPVTIMYGDFYDSAQQLLQCGKTFDLILADFGVSSPQLDRSERGFSFRLDGPLDMRMDRTQALTAGQIVNTWRERDLVEIFVKYGEESLGLAKKHARVIAGGRPWTSTGQLAGALGGNANGGHGSGHGGRSRIHPATKVFQALRIVVNDELGLIERTLPLLPKLLKPGGRVAIISFHSLEDRLVKRYFREESTLGVESELKVLTKSPVTAEKLELGINPRARSAKLRAAMRV